VGEMGAAAMLATMLAPAMINTAAQMVQQGKQPQAQPHQMQALPPGQAVAALPPGQGGQQVVYVQQPVQQQPAQQNTTENAAILMKAGVDAGQKLWKRVIKPPKKQRRPKRRDHEAPPWVDEDDDE